MPLWFHQAIFQSKLLGQKTHPGGLCHFGFIKLFSKANYLVKKHIPEVCATLVSSSYFPKQTTWSKNTSRRSVPLWFHQAIFQSKLLGQKTHPGGLCHFGFIKLFSKANYLVKKHIPEVCATLVSSSYFPKQTTWSKKHIPEVCATLVSSSYFPKQTTWSKNTSRRSVPLWFHQVIFQSRPLRRQVLKEIIVRWHQPDHPRPAANRNERHSGFRRCPC